jgi:hypothetical protein
VFNTDRFLFLPTVLSVFTRTGNIIADITDYQAFYGRLNSLNTWSLNNIFEDTQIKILKDNTNSAGTNGQILTSNGTNTIWASVATTGASTSFSSKNNIANNNFFSSNEQDPDYFKCFRTVSTNCTISKLFIRAETETTGTFTLYKNNVATALSCSLVANTSASDLVDIINFNAGDTYAIFISGVAGGKQCCASIFIS